MPASSKLHLDVLWQCPHDNLKGMVGKWLLNTGAYRIIREAFKILGIHVRKAHR